jgi:hypothetical protein
MRWACLMLAVLLVSCSQSPPPRAAVSPSPSGAASSSRLSSPTPTPIVPVAFSCRLPIMSGVLQGGFVSFPGDNFVPDTASRFPYDARTETFRSTKQPQLVGSDPFLFYDRKLSRWLPSPRIAVYPDGRSYAYVSGYNPTQRVHIVDVASGRERSFQAAHPLRARVFDYSPGGIYLASSLEVGVWLLNPRTGKERLLTNEKIVEAIAGGKAWLETTPQPSNSIYPDALVELDLASRSKTAWFYRDNFGIDLLGLTSEGYPVISVRVTSGEEVWLVRSPGAEERIYYGPRVFDYPPVSDSHGIWLGSSTSGIYFYSRATGIHRVSATLGAPAGTCV